MSTDPTSESKNNNDSLDLFRIAGFFIGPILAILIYAILPNSYIDTDGSIVPLSYEAQAVAAVAVWMAVWWMTEAISIYATALIPLVAFPLTGIATMRETASSYGQEIIFLFLGGFILALSLERWPLHKRLALKVLSSVKSEPRLIVGGFMFVSAALSMWVTNTATTIMLLPVGLSVINMLKDSDSSKSFKVSKNFSICLLLGIAYASSIGGMGTIIGTTPNVFVVSFIREQLDREISFLEWMSFAVPIVLLLVPLTWLWLTRFIYPLGRNNLTGAAEIISETRASMGPMGRPEFLTLLVFITTAFSWVTRPLIVELEIFGLKPFSGLTDAVIAMLAAFSLFIIPSNFKRAEFLMDWRTASKLPWGLLLLLGGGLALAAALTDSGFSYFLGSLASKFRGWPFWLTTMAVVALVIFLTELTSNLATTATFIPVLLAVAAGLELPPLLLIIPAGLAASCAFMLPVATPPNAIVFGSGKLKIKEMCMAGFWLNLLSVIVITFISYAILISVLNIDL
ncbi:MAG: DASS family sodium-coupled anion symporter [Pseudomonadota bacterium]|nr:DASS family sodium-coupled anion symporter [Pseudomonadota bacterium]